VVGGIPQDLKFKGEPARLIIGDNNTIREGATLNIGTEAGSMETRIGSNCLLMAYTHVAHDCVIGNRVIMSNNAALAGHVHIADNVIFGGLAAVHQFCSVGRHAFIAGGGMCGQDVPPFCIAQGDRAQLVGINVVGLKRAGWTRDQIHAVRQAFKQLFLAGSTRLRALEQVEKTLSSKSELVKEMTDFVRRSERGVCPPRVNGSETGDTDDE
jgi:UDP-N-acetylglucosamine acyltransferase